jgi:recombination protein RecT
MTAPGTTVARNPLENLLRAAVPKMMDVLPKSSSIVPEKIIRMALLDVSQNEKLAECTPISIVTAVMHAAALGLHVGPFLGEAWLVPFKGRCQLIPGYRGLLKLAHQGLTVGGVEARLVYADDEFETRYGTDPMIIHIPDFEGERTDDKIIATYMVAKMRSGEVQFNVMTRDEVEKRRKSSRAGQSEDGPWMKWYPEQVLKTAVRTGVKMLPASADSEAYERLNAAVELDNRFDTGKITAPNAVLDTESSLSEDLAAQTRESAGDLRERVKNSRTTTAKVVENDPDLQAELERQRIMDEEEAASGKPKA